MTLLQANSELQIIIRKDLNEDINTRDSYVQSIKEWLLQQPHLPDTMDDVRLMNFLRCCSFSLEKCKKKLDAYFTIRNAIPELFSNRNFKDIKLLKVTKLVSHTPLPCLTKEGRRVNIMRFRYNNFDGRMEDCMKLHLMITDLRLLLEETGITGDVYVLDAETTSMNHLVLLTPALIKKYFVSLFEVYPIKVKEMHVVNVHPFVHIAYSWLKPFLNKKMQNRMHFHSDGIESLYKFVPKEVLPEEYGGNAGKLQQIHDPWIQKLEEYEPWFTEEEDLKSDESKRPGKSIDNREIFGVEGSFKQLSVD